MPRIVPPLDMDYVRELYLSGKNKKQVAQIIGVSTSLLDKRLRLAGVKLSDWRPVVYTKPRCDKLPLNVESIKRRYLAGETKKAIAQSLGVAQMTVHKRLKEVGIMPAANRSEAMNQRLQRMSFAERQELTDAANKAVRGKKRTMEELKKRAQTRARLAVSGSKHERAFAAMLSDRKIHFSQQTAVGIYNADFTIGPVAVEIFGGNWHATVRKELGLKRGAKK